MECSGARDQSPARSSCVARTLWKTRVELPAIVLLVSGGHTFLARMESLTSIQLLGSTRDDSVGEAYDKVARLLGLGFPGGPAVDKLAKTGKASIPFPRPMLNEGLSFRSRD